MTGLPLADYLMKGKSIQPSQYFRDLYLDLSKLFDSEPLPQDLARISSGEDEDLSSEYVDDEDFDMDGDEQPKEPVSKEKIEKTVNKILDIFTNKAFS